MKSALVVHCGFNTPTTLEPFIVGTSAVETVFDTPTTRPAEVKLVRTRETQERSLRGPTPVNRILSQKIRAKQLSNSECCEFTKCSEFTKHSKIKDRENTDQKQFYYIVTAFLTYFRF